MSVRPRQHHYVTRAYLAGFLQPQQGQLFCYGRRRHHVFRCRPEDLAKQRDYYSFRRPDGSWDDSLEHLLDEKIESPGIAVLRKLVARDTRLSWTDRQRLSMFIATQRMRVPYFREALDTNYKHFIQELLADYERKERELGFSPGPMRVRSIGPFDDEPDEGTHFTKESLQKTAASLEKNPRHFSLESFVEFAYSSANIFRHMKWTVHYTPSDTKYLTSDAPVIVRFERDDIEEAGLVRSDCEVRFPLASTCTLSMAHDLDLVTRVKRLGKTARSRRLISRTPEIRILNASAEQVREFNHIQTDFAFRWVFSGIEHDWLRPRLQGDSKNIKQVLTRESENRLSLRSLK
jgi:hypothetical protein